MTSTENDLTKNEAIFFKNLQHVYSSLSDTLEAISIIKPTEDLTNVLFKFLEVDFFHLAN